MTRRMLTVRLRAHMRGERGFTIVETMVAITVIFGSLTALAYTATIGFRYIAFGRDRTQATGFANQIMEGIRALPYSSITKGLNTSEYASDPNIVSCAGVYRLMSCSGEKLVGQTFSGGYTEEWLVPHRGAFTTDNGLELEWATYVTNDDVTANPYSVTVEVSWAGGGAVATGVNNLVRVQTAIWSPTGCVSSTTHPFAAPCQPFFYGQALLPASNITIESGGALGAFHEGAVEIEEGAVVLPGAEAAMQQEQVIDLDASTTTSFVEVIDLSGREEAGLAETLWAADSDPASATTATAGGSATAGTGGYLQRLQPDAGGEIGAKLTVPAGDSAVAGLSTAAKLTDASACPPTGTRETDSLACVGIETTPGGTTTIVAPLSHAVAALGPATVLRITPPPVSSKATVDRDVSATAGDDGLVDSQVTRTLGTIQIGGFPTAGMTAPAGMSTTNTLDTNYCMRITGYSDTARAYAGERTATAPTAAVSAGTFHYYSAGAYLNKGVTDATLNTLAVSCDPAAQVVSGKTGEWDVWVTAGEIARATMTTSSTNDPSNAQIKLETEGRVTPIALTVHYRLLVDSVEEVNVVVTVEIGELVAASSYEPPPEFGI